MDANDPLNLDVDCVENDDDRLVNSATIKVDFPPPGYFEWLAQVKGGWAAFRAISLWHQWKD